MDSFLHMMGPGGLALIFAGIIMMIVWLVRYSINRSTEKAIREEASHNFLTKKLPAANLENYRGTLRNTGLILSIAMVLAAFEYPKYEDRILVTLGTLTVDPDELIEIPITEPPKPKKPPVNQPVVVEAIEDEIEDLEVDFSADIDEDDIIEDVSVEIERDTFPTETADEFVDFAEISAVPKEGMQSFLKWVAKNLKYPSMAKRTSVEGKVFVQFIIEKDGSMSNIHVVKGIGAGCDEEALRVMKKATPWNPGKQRGRTVRQRMVLPINFRLAR